MAVREPERRVPAALAVYEREDGVDGVVRLVPALRPSFLEPALRLAELRPGARQVGMEHERDAVVRDAERPPATGAAQLRGALLGERGAAEWAPQQVDRDRQHRATVTDFLQRFVTLLPCPSRWLRSRLCRRAF